MVEVRTTTPVRGRRKYTREGLEKGRGERKVERRKEGERETEREGKTMNGCVCIRGEKRDVGSNNM